MRTPIQAVAWAVKEHLTPSRDWTGMCLMFVRTCFGVAALYPSAGVAWQHTTRRHTTTPPPGVPVWWTGGRSGYGHVAISAGSGYVWSTDAVRRGKVDRVSIGSITRNWGLSYQGWSEDINDVRVYTPPVRPPKPTISLTATRRALRRGTTVQHGAYLKRAIAAEVGRGLMGLSGNRLGWAVRRQVRKVQRKFLIANGRAVTATATDGIFGPESFAWLGHRRRFIPTP